MEWEEFLRKYSKRVHEVCSAEDLTLDEVLFCRKMEHLVEFEEDPVMYSPAIKGMLRVLRDPLERKRFTRFTDLLLDMVSDYVEAVRGILRPFMYEDIEKEIRKIKEELKPSR